MKFKLNDQVLVTAGKDKGKKSKIIKIIPKSNKVVVEGVNLYTKHIRKTQGKAGEIVRRERALPLSNIAILNEKGQPDRIGYIMQGDTKARIFKKTKTVITESKK